MTMISWRRAEKREPLCVVGGNVSTVITDNSIEVLQKTENRISICYNNATAGHLPKGIPNQYVKEMSLF